MQKIADPDAKGEEDEQRQVFHVLQGDDALPDATGRRFHLTIYIKALEQNVQQNQDSNDTNSRHQIARQRESLEDGVEAGARLGEERAKNAQLEQQRQSCYRAHQQGVDGSFRHHRAKGLRERTAVETLQHPTTGELSKTGNDEAHGIRQEDGIDARRSSRMLIDGFQRLLPSPSSEQLCQDAEGKREQHPRPVHFLQQNMPQPHEILTTIHPIKNGPTQQDRGDDFGDVSEDRFHFHGDKGTNKN